MNYVRLKEEIGNGFQRNVCDKSYKTPHLSLKVWVSIVGKNTEFIRQTLPKEVLSSTVRPCWESLCRKETMMTSNIHQQIFTIRVLNISVRSIYESFSTRAQDKIYWDVFMDEKLTVMIQTLILFLMQILARECIACLSVIK